MNILTFDIEEWYVEKAYGGGRVFKYQQFDEVFARMLDLLDSIDIKATFFCVGQLAVEFPDVIRSIVARGHEIGCHSNIHTWLDKMDEKMLRDDTTEALQVLQDVSGQKVTCYRAPAFSITPKNKWAVDVLAECGIESDASIFPAIRDFGGYPMFPQDTPCTISYNGAKLKEYPVSITSFIGKRIAYSGGGYFRIIPYWIVNKIMKSREYNICYFHLSDLIQQNNKLLTKKAYEEYFKESGTFKNRLIRFAKSNVGRGDVFGKMQRLLVGNDFVNIQQANRMIDWQKAELIQL